MIADLVGLEYIIESEEPLWLTELIDNNFRSVR